MCRRFCSADKMDEKKQAVLLPGGDCNLCRPWAALSTWGGFPVDAAGLCLLKRHLESGMRNKQKNQIILCEYFSKPLNSGSAIQGASANLIKPAVTIHR